MYPKGSKKLNHPPLYLAENTPRKIRIQFSAYEKVVLREGHDHELVLELDGHGNIKTSRLVEY